MGEFKLGTVAVAGHPRMVMAMGDRWIDVRKAAGRYGPEWSASWPTGALDSLLATLDCWDESLPLLAGLCQRLEMEGGAGVDDAGLHVKDGVLKAPVLFPRKVLLAAANYRDQLAEMRGTLPDKSVTRPYFFQKSPTTCIVGSGEPIVLPAGSSKVDWEAELGVVIGRRAKGVPANDAMNYVAGYLVINDVSARDRAARADRPGGRLDWMALKCFDTFAPTGPFVTPKEFVQDPHNLGLRLWVNGDLKQDSNTRNMIFSIPELIEYISELTTLEPGDIIATGTPAGIGAANGTFLSRGDLIEIEIDGVGTLKNPVV